MNNKYFILKPTILAIILLIVGTLQYAQAEVSRNKKPTLIPLTKSINLREHDNFVSTCGLSSGDPPFTFRWYKDGDPLVAQQGDDLKIEIMNQFSVLTVQNLRSSDSGTYRCEASNSAGSDSSATALHVKVPPSWISEPSDVHMSTKKGVIECTADGSPKPTIKWITSKGVTIESSRLDIERYRSASSSNRIDTYECVADNGVGEPLRKKITVSFMAPAKFVETDLSVVKVRRGEAARLSCNATGDSPLSVVWTRANVKLDRIGSNYEIIDTTTDGEIRSTMTIHSAASADASIYKCFAENEHGKDEKSIRLLVSQAPDSPKNVRVKEVWSRTVAIAWNAPPSAGNTSPITKYIVQYWRRQSAPHRLHESTIGGTYTSTSIDGLTPGQAYELTVTAENDIGKGTASSTVTFITGEEEPSAPPNDIMIESVGPTTIRATWRSPPIENWNGNIRGYYIGYRKTREPTHPFVNTFVPANIAEAGTQENSLKNGQENGPNNHQQSKEIRFYEHFIRKLDKATDYIVVIRAYNSAGSGPASHETSAQTFDGDLPAPVKLSVLDATEDTISLRWHRKLDTTIITGTGTNNPVISYSIHYRVTQDDQHHRWHEIPVLATSVATSSASSNAAGPVDPNGSPIETSAGGFNSYSFVVQKLEPNYRYMLYVTAVNRYGVSDPSNLVHARTGASIASSHDIYHRSSPFYRGADYYYHHLLQPHFFWAALTASVIVVVVLIIAYACVRKARNDAQNAFSLDAATLNKRLSAAYGVGTTPRYMDFEAKNASMMAAAAGGAMDPNAISSFPTPYATLPMGALGAENNPQMDRPLPALKKEGPHIYDYAQ